MPDEVRVKRREQVRSRRDYASISIGPNNGTGGKPFVYEELVARMRAVLRRVSGPHHRRLSVRALEIDLAARVVRVGGERVQLSAKEFDLLVALAEDPERVLRKEELLRDVCGFRSLGRTRTLESHAGRPRSKLNATGDCQGGDPGQADHVGVPPYVAGTRYRPERSAPGAATRGAGPARRTAGG